MRERDQVIQVRCFGTFEATWQGKPLEFRLLRTKEVLAYLIDARGRLCSREEIAQAVWNGELDPMNTRRRVRGAVTDLQTTLNQLGLGNALDRAGTSTAIRREWFNSDLEQLLAGDSKLLRIYRGNYLENYPWADATRKWLKETRLPELRKRAKAEKVSGTASKTAQESEPQDETDMAEREKKMAEKLPPLHQEPVNRGKKPIEGELAEEGTHARSIGEKVPGVTAKWVKVTCFGTFSVRFNRKPIRFARARTMELLAHLVDQQGRMCSTDELVFILWPDAPELSRKIRYLSVLISDLRKTLRELGLEAMIDRRYKRLGIRTELLDCDYYHYLRRTRRGRNIWNGQYMEQYAWAEERRQKLRQEQLMRRPLIPAND